VWARVSGALLNPCRVFLCSVAPPEAGPAQSKTAPTSAPIKAMAAPGSAGWCDARLDAPGRTVLFAACDSSEARDAFVWSRANLLRQQDTVVLVHAYAKDAVFGGNFNVLAEGKRVMAVFEAMCKEREVRFRSVLAQGDPARIIAAAAHANRCDLCVMGCRGLGPVKRVLKGSVRSVRLLLRHALTPLYVLICLAAPVLFSSRASVLINSAQTFQLGFTDLDF
jgi:nucleotide-binding universal stress UspA family protein